MKCVGRVKGEEGKEGITYPNQCSLPIQVMTLSFKLKSNRTPYCKKSYWINFVLKNFPVKLEGNGCIAENRFGKRKCGSWEWSPTGISTNFCATLK